MPTGIYNREKYYGTPEQRFWKSVDKKGENECWEWVGGTVTGGYGKFSVNRKYTRVHRFSYELHKGKIPKGEGYHGMCVCHSCDNPLCVNPKHLRLGTQKENIQEMFTKGRNNWRTKKAHQW